MCKPGHKDVHPSKQLFENYLKKIKEAPTNVKKRGILGNAQANRSITPEQYRELELKYYQHV